MSTISDILYLNREKRELAVKVNKGAGSGWAVGAAAPLPSDLGGEGGQRVPLHYEKTTL